MQISVSLLRRERPIHLLQQVYSFMFSLLKLRRHSASNNGPTVPAGAYREEERECFGSERCFSATAQLK